MRLLVDARYVRPVHDGISRFTSNILHSLARGIASGEYPDLELAMLVSDDAQLDQLPSLPCVRGYSPTGPLEPLSALAVNRFRPDVVFSPMQTMGSWGRKYKLILTLHDLIYYDHPDPPGFLPAPVRIGWRLFHRSYFPQRLLLNRADAVVTVSRTTASLIEEHNLTTRPVTVIPNAPPRGIGITREQALDRAAHRRKSLVYMGSAMPYKGVELLIRGMENLPDYELHLLSKYDPRRKEELQATVPQGASVTFHDGVTDDDYRRLLATCTALVTASSAEGYGLPLAEAAAEGTARIVSNIPIFREIAPNAAHIEYSEPGEFVEAVRNLEDPDNYRTAALGALDDAARYSWDDSSRELIDLASSL
ncbi:MAG: glycosyltransferase [Kocuria sp.]|nr:glycosyltransferase [Kocuria sp.]MDN5617625.1 glycosyltransferase [Kocuria sp.]